VAKSNAGTGKAFTFHGSYESKILAARKEREIPGSFIIKRDGRYYVLKPKKVRSVNATPRIKKSNPSRTLIYEKITRVEGTKGKASHFSGQRFFHNFKKPYPKMFGLPNGDLLITSRK
jgi:hypothetical protein